MLGHTLRDTRHRQHHSIKGTSTPLCCSPPPLTVGPQVTADPFSGLKLYLGREHSSGPRAGDCGRWRLVLNEHSGRRSDRSDHAWLQVRPIGAALCKAVDGRDALMALQEASFQLVAVTARWGHSPTFCIANTETWLKTNGCVRLLL